MSKPISQRVRECRSGRFPIQIWFTEEELREIYNFWRGCISPGQSFSEWCKECCFTSGRFLYNTGRGPNDRATKSRWITQQPSFQGTPEALAVDDYILQKATPRPKRKPGRPKGSKNKKKKTRN